MPKILSGVTITAVVAYLVIATIDAKYGVTYKLAQSLPLPNAS